MARYVFPDDREAFVISPEVNSPIRNGVGQRVQVYTDEARTQLADIRSYPDSQVVTELVIGPDSLIPDFYGPEGVSGPLYVCSVLNRADYMPVYQKTADRLAAIDSALAGALNPSDLQGLNQETTQQAILTKLLGTLTAVVSGQVSLDANTLAALEQINASVSGSVAVTNLPAVQPVSGTVGVDPATVTQLGQDSSLQAILSAITTQAATVAAEQAVQSSVDALASWLSRSVVNQDPAARLPYAKTVTDQLRVVVDSGGIAVTAVQLWNGNGYTTWWNGSGAVNSMDARENQKIISEQNAVQVRTTRWQVT